MSIIYTDPNGNPIDEWGEVAEEEENLSPEQWEIAEKFKERDAADLPVRD